MNHLLFQGVEGVEDISQSLASPDLATENLDTATSQQIEDADPKLREECGVMAVYGHPDAARQVYLGLYALQHRGQESAGIAVANGHQLSNIKGMGLVAEIFTDDILAKLPGDLAIGHTRYSTTGDSALLNAQPIRVDSTKGLIAIAHNGNLSILATYEKSWGAQALTSKPLQTRRSLSNSLPTPRRTRW